MGVVGPEKALTALVAAAEAAATALSPEAAEGYLRQGLDLVEQLPIGPNRDHAELDLQDRLGTLYALTKGTAAPETTAAWARAVTLCRDTDDWRRLLRSYWALYSSAFVLGDLEDADRVAAELLRLGLTSADGGVVAVGRLATGALAFLRGQREAAHAHLVEAKRIVDRGPEPALTDVLYVDLTVQICVYLGSVTSLGGATEEGRQLAAIAAVRARRLGEPFTLAVALAQSALNAVIAGERLDAELLASELLAHAEKHRLVDFELPAATLLEWAQAGAGGEGDDLVTDEAFERYPLALFRPLYLGIRAEVSWRRRRRDEAMARLDRAFAAADRSGEAFYLAELHRLRGEVLAASGAEAAEEAAGCFQRAVAVAEAQGARLLQGRAEASWARLRDARHAT